MNSKECRILSVSYQFIARELFKFVVRKSKDSAKGECLMPSDRQKVDKGLSFSSLKVFKDEKQKVTFLVKGMLALYICHRRGILVNGILTVVGSVKTIIWFA